MKTLDKVINFGKIDFNHCGRKINLVTMNIRLIDRCFTVSCRVYNIHQTKSTGADCNTLLPFFKDDEFFMKVRNIWKKHRFTFTNGKFTSNATEADIKAIKELF